MKIEYEYVETTAETYNMISHDMKDAPRLYEGKTDNEYIFVVNGRETVLLAYIEDGKYYIEKGTADMLAIGM